MTKKKFSKEERWAIIEKLKRIAHDKNEELLKTERECYVPSEKYKELEKAINKYNIAQETLNKACKQCKLDISYYQQKIENPESKLNQVRDAEIKSKCRFYSVDKEKLELELILFDDAVANDQLFETLLTKYC